MRRREFITLLGGAAAAWPLAAWAQQPDRVRRIAVLQGAVEEHDPESQVRIAAFRQGLEALGWTEGRNIRIDYRFAGGDADRIQAHVAEIVGLAPDLIVANSSPVIVALKRATSTIPIVFAVVNDPVNQGFVASLAKPGGNITGFTLIEFEMIGKWIELIKEMAPRIRRMTLLYNPVTAPYFASFPRELAAASPHPALCLLRRSHPQRRQPCRPGHPETHEIQAGHYLKTAKALGLDVTANLLALADEVIE